MDGIVRIGLVSDVDSSNRKVRVLYPDSGMVSAWLSVLRHGTSDTWIPGINDSVVCLYLPIFNADGFVLGVV